MAKPVLNNPLHAKAESGITKKGIMAKPVLNNPLHAKCREGHCKRKGKIVEPILNMTSENPKVALRTNEAKRKSLF